MTQYTYRPDVLQAVQAHGVQPTSQTSPVLVRNFVRDLYKYELRKLRDRYVRQEFPKREYYTRVEALRNKYPVLALVARLWVLEPLPPGAGADDE